MNCSMFEDILEKVVHFRVSDRVLANAFSHLSECRKCRDDYRITSMLLRSAPNFSAQPAFRDIWPGILKRHYEGTGRGAGRASRKGGKAKHGKKRD